MLFVCCYVTCFGDFYLHLFVLLALLCGGVGFFDCLAWLVLLILLSCLVFSVVCFV